MKMKKIADNELKILMQEIRAFSKARKKLEKEDRGALDSSSITNKDVMFYFLAQIAEIDRRMTVVETKQKMACWFIGIVLSIIGLCVAVMSNVI